MILLMIRFALAFVLAILAGKLVAKFKLPAILGWLLAGMLLGPHAIGLVNQSLLDLGAYEKIVNLLECAVGLMIGTELVWKNIKKAGVQIVVTTLTQSIGTFLLVSAVFCGIFYFMEIPLYVGFILGGISLATAPAPALSIVREFHTKGPVTSTLIPMAAMDDLVGVIIFFTVITVVNSLLATGDSSTFLMVLIVILPLLIGALVGFVSGWIMKQMNSPKAQFINLIASVMVTSLIGITINYYVLPSPMLNFMLMGMAYSAVFANMIKEIDLQCVMQNFNPILSVAMVVVILNLGTPLDYHLILGAGLFTAIYIIFRGLGKYFGAWFGSTITHAPETVRKYLGLTLLPHSGVSLVFTGIAVSTLSGTAPECAQIIQGTIAAAAIINEVIAVIVAKKGFEWANELHGGIQQTCKLNSQESL